MPTPPSTTATGWAACAALQDQPAARLACYDRWASGQTAATASAQTTAPAATPTPATAAPQAPALPALPVRVEVDGCRDRRYSDLSRFWELETGTDCHTLGLRGYRPVSLSLIGSDSVNTAPSSDAVGHTASFTPYRTTETRLQLSVRTKIAKGILPSKDPDALDSLWFGYTQQSYWQLFSAQLSRPFRNTDHEPELVYIYPTTLNLPAGWRLRYSGLGVSHQSNGQTLPLSRSWNRVYLMGGMERGRDFQLTGRVWQRLPEKYTDDDNPNISDYIGRAELTGTWNVNADHTLGATWRHSLQATSRGSVRLEWLRSIGERDTSSLRFHTQLFSGYGDSLVDFNRRRTVLSLGLSLVDF